MHRSVTRTFQCQYRLWAPAGYKAGTRRRYPLVLFLHGAGERGKDISLVLKHGPPRQAAEGRRFPFFLLAPQCPEHRAWQPCVLSALLDEVTEAWPIDSARIYVTGISMGGLGTWSLANAFPERFAAIAPVCGPFIWIQPERFKKLPVWCFHGAMDEAVPLQDSIRIVKMLRSHGVAVRFTVYPDANHDAWTPTFNNPAFCKWLLSKRRRAR